MISCPPRHGKSEQITVHGLAYLLELNPHWRFMIGAYNEDLSRDFSRSAQRLYTGPVRADFDAWRTRMKGPYTGTETQWRTAYGGGVRALGVGSGATGKGAEGIFIDDPIKSRAEANSQAYRNRCWSWYTNELRTRLEPGGFMVLIMTRWHEDDLAGRIMEHEPGRWMQINLPALAEPTEDEPDLLGREAGEPLWADRFDREELLELQALLHRDFQALYQGRPTALEGGMFKRDWIRRYARLPDVPTRRVISLDCANKAKELNDYSAATYWHSLRTDNYLVHATRGRMTYPRLYDFAVAYAESHPHDAMLIEDKGNGTALIQDLRQNTTIRVVAVEPTADKITRASNESIAYAAGQVHHPLGNTGDTAWIAELESELLGFPETANDDYVDSITQFLAFAGGNLGGGGWGSRGRRATADLGDEAVPTRDKKGGRRRRRVSVDQ